MINLTAITLKQLRAVGAVKETGSISGAADKLGLTPPAVHSQLRTLEDLIGCALIRKSDGGGMELSAEGQLVLELIAEIDEQLAVCLQRIQAMRKGLSGAVNLGVVSTGKYFAPVLVAGLKKSFPEIEIALKVGNRDQVLSAIRNKSVDLVVMGRPPRSPLVKATVIGPHPHIVIAAPDHRLAQMRFVPPRQLLDETIVSREPGSGTRILMTRYLDRVGEGKPYDTIVMDSNETIKQAVMAGLGVALISQHTVTEELKAGRLVAINTLELPINRHWFLLHRADLVLSPAMQTVWDYTCEHGEDFLPGL